MKLLFTLFFISFFLGCGSYSDAKYFNCTKTENYTKDTDKKELIYKILKRAVVDKKDIPDYNLIKDKKKIYINNEYYGALQGEEAKKAMLLDISEIPPEIGEVSFCLKSKTELQTIANKTSDFLYLSFGELKIDGDIATIGIETGWQPKINSENVYLSGGGYVCQFIKVNGEWKFDKVLKNWMS